MSKAAALIHSGRALVRLRYAIPKIFATLLALLLAAVWIGPLALMVITSIKPNREFLNGPFALPIAPTIEPYLKVWEGLHFGVLLQNSLIYAVTGSALSVGLALVPAFALSRFEPPGKK
jgi:raffinose/stachyose/melibiose transport system permease protein